jgi:CRP-like cAMP-binding protein
MAGSDLVTVLRGRLCPGLTMHEAEQVASATMPHRTPAGERICREGEPSVGLIFMVRGTAEILRSGPEGAQVVATVNAPIMLGEIALLTGHAISATVRARGDCDCYVLTRSQFHRLTEEGSAAGYKLVMAMAQLLAHRLTAMNDRVIALSQG